jgi:hypothetical protein
MILTKMIINVCTGEVENIPLTDEEIVAHEAAAQLALETAAKEIIEPVE